MNFACIDCGSHSTRLLIAETPKASAMPATLHRDMQITKMGEGVQETGELSSESIKRTLDVIKEYVNALDEFEVPKSNLKIIATAAARMANNRDELFESIQKLTGVEVELLDGDKEASLTFLGAVGTLEASKSKTFQSPYLCLDIGGGSSEFSFGSTSKCEASVSFDIGSVNLTEKYISHDPVKPEELHSCLSVVEAHLSDLVQQIPQVTNTKTFLGTAGTITTVAAVELGFYDPEKVHHFRLSIDAVEDVFRTLSTENREQRLANPGLHPGRADVIVAGLTVLVKTMRFFNFTECIVSESDLLEGAILEMTDNG